MNRELIVRAWKDPEFRESLSGEERAALPEQPSGTPLPELDEAALASAVGGQSAVLFGGGGLRLDDDTTCICSNFTGPLTTRFTTVINTTVAKVTVVQRQLGAVVLGP